MERRGTVGSVSDTPFRRSTFVGVTDSSPGTPFPDEVMRDPSAPDVSGSTFDFSSF